MLSLHTVRSTVTHRYATKHEWVVTVARVIVGVVSVQGLLFSSRFNSESDDACNLRFSHDRQAVLALPVRIVRAKHTICRADEQGIHNQLGRRIRVPQDSVRALGGAGEEARRVHMVRVEAGLELVSDALT